MEDGSLLQEALEYMERLREGEVDDDDKQDALQLDVYDLQSPSDRVERLLQLAQLASVFNVHFQECEYLWHTGCPPVFGIHVSPEGIPHLRALCQYGDNVDDEWMAIRLMVEFSQKHPTVAIDCWDLDVGPILLIEGSSGLPEWLSDGNVEDSRHLCWIVKGEVTLIGPTTLGFTLTVALDCLQRERMLSKPTQLQMEIKKTLDGIHTNHHRTAVVVPRPVARLLQHAPELANTAAIAFAKSPILPTAYEDWVWTTCALARTNYAMLRTVLPKTPQEKLSAELKRFRRACSNEATPHVQHALEVGMHLTAGFDVLLEQRVNGEGLDAKLPPIQRRVLQYWTRLDIECGGDGDWLRQAWRMGPNESQHDITHIMKCPVYEYEHEYPYPLFHPGLSMQQVIRAEMRRKSKDEERYLIPLPEDVHDEGWMHRGDEALEEAMAKKVVSVPEGHTSTMEARREQELDEMLQGIEKFMLGESEIEGISHGDPAKQQMSAGLEESTQHRIARGPDESVEINPRVFLNLLHEVLKATPEDLARKLTDVSKDPYFSEEDYALMEPDDSSEDETDSHDVVEMDTLMVCFLSFVMLLVVLTLSSFHVFSYPLVRMQWTLNFVLPRHLEKSLVRNAMNRYPLKQPRRFTFFPILFSPWVQVREHPVQSLIS